MSGQGSTDGRPTGDLYGIPTYTTGYDKYSAAGNVSGLLQNYGTGGKIGASILTPHKSMQIWGNKGGGPMMLGPMGVSLEEDMARQTMLSKMYGRLLNQDLTTGKRMGDALVAQGAFGRIDENPYKAKLEGYSSAENQALRDVATRGNMRAYATARENLARSQAYSGTRGPAASYQATKLGRDFNRANIESNQNLMIQNVGQKERALQNLTQVQQSNQRNARDELASRLGIQFGYGQLGSAQRAGAAQYFANKDAMNMQTMMFNAQQANAPKGGGGK